MLKKVFAWVGYGILVLVDKLANVLSLGNWHVTISMRLSFAIHCKYVVPRYSWVVPFAGFVDWLFDDALGVEKEHIKNSYEAVEVVNSKFWLWYVIIDQEGFDKMVEEMKKAEKYGFMEAA